MAACINPQGLPPDTELMSVAEQLCEVERQRREEASGGGAAGEAGHHHRQGAHMQGPQPAYQPQVGFEDAY